MTAADPSPPPSARWQMWPLYAAGFTTAFGAHGIAANLGAETGDLRTSLLYLGVLLALYDGAEVVLKPVFGTLADRIGARPVLLGGLIGFAAASLVFVLVDDPGWLWLARLGQGAAASAFSPAASALVARMNPKAKHGKAFGTYGFYKSIGYTLGPLLGGVVVWIGGLTLLFAVLSALAAAVAVWAAVSVPTIAPLPRSRQTLVDLALRLSDRTFLRPTAALAFATAALSVGVGFLPVSGAAAGLGPVATGAAVSVLAACAALVQPKAGRALDAGRLSANTGAAVGLVVTGLGLGCAMLPGLEGVLLAAVGIGVGTGLITPLAFASLASSTPEDRMGQTMGAAELGRELGDAGGPLLVAGAAAAATLTVGYAVLAGLTLAAPAVLTGNVRLRRSADHQPSTVTDDE
jgi:MFS family permease